MKTDTELTIASLLAIVLTMWHLADDVVRGYEPGGLENLRGMLILSVWLFGTLALNGTRSGYVILMLGSLLASVIPLAHLRGAGVGGTVAHSDGGLFFIWTLFALGTLGPFMLVLSARGLWKSRQARRVQ